MIFINKIERHPDTGWKILDRDMITGILTTPYLDQEMVIGRTYIATGTENHGIYVFLNKIVAKKFLEDIAEITSKQTLLAKVELGKNVWKGKADPYYFSEFGKYAYHFFTTNAVRIVSLE